MRKFIILIFFSFCLFNFSFAQDANNPIDPSPTIGLFNRSYSDDFLRSQIIANMTVNKKWFVRVSAEQQFNYNSDNEFKSVSLLVARLFQTKDGKHNFGIGGIISYIEPKGIAAGVNVVSTSRLGKFKIITLTTFQVGNNISTMEFQPGIYYDLPKGWYLRGHPRMIFDFESNTNEVPIGAGFGKIIKSTSLITNLFFEPQYDLAQNRSMLYIGAKFLF
jgi:hypothetical protein